MIQFKIECIYDILIIYIHFTFLFLVCLNKIILLIFIYKIYLLSQLLSDNDLIFN
jgi:hypothetical protein